MSPTVMIVDDDRDVRESIAEVLEDCHYRVLRAKHGAEALSQLRARDDKPCLILLDLTMPVMDAWQFREAQEREPELARVPVVILSAHAKIHKAAQELHVPVVLEKPVKLDTLLDTVAKFCGRGSA